MQTYTRAEEELTAILVTELLAISTQKSILSGAQPAERIIEIGPGETLINMAKKTLDISCSVQDLVAGRTRQLLSYAKNAEDIQYSAQSPLDAEIPTQSHDSSSTESTQLPVAAPIAPMTSASNTGPLIIEDIPLNAADVLRTIVCTGLKKQPDRVSFEETIKRLCGENEIVGDLTVEFGNLPDQPEDLTLSQLATALNESQHERALGAWSNSRIGRFATSKLSSGSSLSSLRRYLSSRWGLGQGLQDQVLLASLFNQPSARHSDETATKGFLDDMTRKILAAHNINYEASSAGTMGQPAATSNISPEVLLALQKDSVAHDENLLSVYARRCNRDLGDSSKSLETIKREMSNIQSQLDLWLEEHGQFYADNLGPKFDPLKVRTYDSSWNWVLQDFMAWESSWKSNPENEITTATGLDFESLGFETRATSRLLQTIDFIRNRSAQGKVRIERLERIRQSVSEAIEKPPTFRCSSELIKSFANMDEPKKDAPPNFKLPLEGDDSYFTESIFGQNPTSSTSETSTPEEQSDGIINTPLSTISSRDEDLNDQAMAFEPRGHALEPTIKTKGQSGWSCNASITADFHSWVKKSSTNGSSFEGQTILVTGAGNGSIGQELIRLLLTAGARVLVTTSSYSTEVTNSWQALYAKHGGRGSQLSVLPFNGGSKKDIMSVVDYIFNNLGWDLDIVVPFAAIKETGRGIDNIDSRSEMAHRAMLTNAIRLLGAIKTQKENRRIFSNPTQVILPLSPNHGIFGNDGLYAESKLGLESLLNKYQSEDWQMYLSICGVVIGWTRGTGLMASNDNFAKEIDRRGDMRTFSTSEMASYIACLMTGPVHSLCQMEPLLADISGNMSSHPDLKGLLNQIRAEQGQLKKMADIRARDEGLESLEQKTLTSILRPRPMMVIDSYKFPDDETEVAPIRKELEGIVDLDHVAVIVGYGEVGPFGSSRTRWEIEATGKLSIQGCVEMAWQMGLIHYHNGVLKGVQYCGWVDEQSRNPISDCDVKVKYEEYIVNHTGLRFWESQDDESTGASQQSLLHEVHVTEDVAPFEVTLETAEDLQRQHGDKVDIFDRDGETFARLKAGATLLIPKGIKLDVGVGGQIPKGWNASVYGISDEIISQVDPVTLWTIVSTVEALLSAGITDFYELYQHLHVSDVGICVGAGMGAAESIQKMWKGRYMDQPVQKDILAETFINTTGAWVNMLLLGASGPIRTPVGACATALESVDTGYDLITTGKAKLCLVGGFDALQLETAAEFRNMQATVNATQETVAGREPREMSRPMTSSRAGFVEAEGSGVQVMTTAQLALDMGLPIHGIVALSHTASDKIGRSVPAPGEGLLTVVAEAPSKFPSPMLKTAYRRRNIVLRNSQIEEKRAEDLAWLDENANSYDADSVDCMRSEIEMEAERSQKEVLRTYGNRFWERDDRVSPLRGALAVWGLTVDDLDFASLHGTSTIKNDLNETNVIQQQNAQLGRTKGNLLPCVCQKWLTGHGKGAAAAFALNGCLQVLSSGQIPGNRNADNIDQRLDASNYLVFPNRTIVAPRPLKAFTVTSFGFGQKNAQVIGVHPRYLFAAISAGEYREYQEKVTDRRRRAFRHFQDGLYGGKLVQLKDNSPYADSDTAIFLMNSKGRLSGEEHQ
ncbi:unnamed protein product [Penicillium pancosmium]